MNNELANLMKDAARLAQDAAEAASRGDVEGALAFQSRAERVMVRVRQLTVQKTAHRRIREPSLRERAIVALTELDVPSAPREIAAFISAKQGQEFDVRALASIRRDEYRAWQIGSKRDTFLVPALEGPWLVAGRGRFALSHWPLWQRVIGPLTTRADHLRVTLAVIQTIEKTASIAPKDSQRAVRMRNLLAVYARSIPDAVEDAWSDSSEIDLGRVHRAASSELTLIGGEDERMRRAQAERAARSLTEEQLLWGGEMPRVVDRPRAGE
jgi:hypothetical protein